MLLASILRGPFFAAPNPPKAYTTTVEVEESDGEMNEIMSLKPKPPDYAHDKVGSPLTLGHTPYHFPRAMRAVCKIASLVSCHCLNLLGRLSSRQNTAEGTY